MVELRLFTTQSTQGHDVVYVHLFIQKKTEGQYLKSQKLMTYYVILYLALNKYNIKHVGKNRAPNRFEIAAFFRTLSTCTEYPVLLNHYSQKFSLHF